MTPTPSRFDLYGPIHKALRAWMAGALVQLGSADLSRPDERGQALDAVQALLAQLRSHVAHENEFIHALLHTRCPGVADEVASEHYGHLASITALEADVAALRHAEADRAAALGPVLYHRLAAFVAENLEHMHTEEHEHNPALWAAYTDAELLEVHDRLMASLPPAEVMACLRWLAQGLPVPDLAAMLDGLRGEPAAFQSARAETVRWLPEARRQQLARALDTAAVPA